MKSRIFSIILSVFLFSQISFAKICAVLKDVHAGEIHTLVIDDSNCLWACGAGYLLGLGDVSGNVLWLQQVHGPNGIGNLKHIVSFDAGWVHSLTAASAYKTLR